MTLSFKVSICLILALAFPCYCNWVPGQVQSSVGDAQDFNDPKYYSDIQLQNLFNSTFYFIRGQNGLEMFFYNYTTANWITLPTLTDLSDSNGWGDSPGYYTTIQVVSIDNNFWVVARNAGGLVLYLYNVTAGTWNPKQGLGNFSDANGWNNPQYYNTIQAFNQSGDVWVFARGPDGQEVWQYDLATDSWSQQATLSALSDANGWGNGSQYYDTIQVVNTNDNFYLFGRFVDGLEVYQFDPSTNTWTQQQTLPDLSDANGWNVTDQYETIQAFPFQNNIWVFARGANGLNLFEWNPSTNTWTTKAVLPNLSDANGWSGAPYYSTIQPVTLNNVIVALARGPDGLEFYTYDPTSDTWTQQDTLPNLSDDNQWNNPEYYETIKSVEHDNQVTVFARGISGIAVYTHQP